MQGAVGQVSEPPRKLQKAMHEARACAQSISGNPLLQFPKFAGSPLRQLAINKTDWHCGGEVVVVVVLVVVVVGHGPQSSVPPQPLATIPQSCAPQALGVQQVPKSGFAFPGGGAGFMQLRLQQLMSVAHREPSALQPPSPRTSRGQTASTAIRASSTTGPRWNTRGTRDMHEPPSSRNDRRLAVRPGDSHPRRSLVKPGPRVVSKGHR